ncbi:MAG TPA: hypothetical protein VMW56_28935 [Candidatus Margulisiibacteriota bacterium]|nr:hypothetical protein [Candidatus Margulisiibacteriota bacterium]
MQPRRLGTASLLLLATTTPFLLALGSTGGRDVIHPAVDFQATLVDKDGVSVDVNRLNIGGDVQLEGDMGRGNLRIQFDNIASVEFTSESHEYSQTTVHLKNGEAVNMRVRNSLMIYGQTKVGIYQIRARDLRSITFKS